MDNILKDIIAERQRQDDKFGADRNQHNYIWNAILLEEVGEASKECLEIDFDKKSERELRAELVQVAAVAVAWIENLDRKSLNEQKWQ